MTAENILSVLGSIAVIGSVIVQAINLVDLIQMDQYLKRRDREEARRYLEEERKRQKEIEKAQSELPDWVEEWIDKYLASSDEVNSDEDNCQ